MCLAYHRRVSRPERLAAISLVVALAAIALLTDVRGWWASPAFGWAGPWVLWVALIGAGGLVAALSPHDDG